MPTVYLVSGANRGIGLGIVVQLAARPDTVVFAGARSPASATELQTLAKTHPNVHVVKLSSADEVDNEAAVQTIKKTAGRLDVVIANAGINKSYGPVVETPLADMWRHWEVNAGGPLILFQKTSPLLFASPRTDANPPKFIVISSLVGSIENAGIMTGLAAYRNSKAAVNQLTREIHFEHERDALVAFPICPGGVATDMAAEVTAKTGRGAGITPNTVENSVSGLLSVIDTATRETRGGKYINYAAESLPW